MKIKYVPLFLDKGTAEAKPMFNNSQWIPFFKANGIFDTVKNEIKFPYDGNYYYFPNAQSKKFSEGDICFFHHKHPEGTGPLKLVRVKEVIVENGYHFVFFDNVIEYVDGAGKPRQITAANLFYTKYFVLNSQLYNVVQQNSQIPEISVVEDALNKSGKGVYGQIDFLADPKFDFAGNKRNVYYATTQWLSAGAARKLNNYDLVFVFDDKGERKDYKLLRIDMYLNGQYIDYTEQVSKCSSLSQKNIYLNEFAKYYSSIRTVGNYVLSNIIDNIKKGYTSEDECEANTKSNCYQIFISKFKDWDGRPAVSASDKKATAAVTAKAVSQSQPQQPSQHGTEYDEFGNVIFYGVPGCGKSSKVSKLLEKGGVTEKYYKRVLFHPEYTYSDFVGQILPRVTGTSIDYAFTPGPFTNILADAHANSDEKFYLIIEEINRGNAPQIFGDIFQLLDRKSGESEYPISNDEVLKCINDRLAQQGKAFLSSVTIPKNLIIFATMNTCDQNVFALDTAFKRRWRMTRIKNSFDDCTLRDEIIDGLNITWGQFATAVNNSILDAGELNSEDKQLGAYFVSEREIQNRQAFAEKVLMYLWNDVFKFNHSIFTEKTLDDLIDKFCDPNVGLRVFVDAEKMFGLDKA